ncbi:hypothetical protein ACHAXA_004568 [Cyclostephanos tholiformis]|uniref:L domain-like protein n=1 Tax=Cyclostephanos tholiformis TaxID=382380 RepID=A0ABD3RFD8_9STRA
MPSSNNNKVRNILSGCEDLLNDFSLPEEHSQHRFVSIDLGNNGNSSVASSPTITPGTNMATNTPGGGNSTQTTRTKHVQTKRAWERAIDKYVASVLDDERAGGSSSSSTTTTSTTTSKGGLDSTGKSTRSAATARSMNRRVHPDNHLLDALRAETASVTSIPRVTIDGHFVDDDSSFEPMDPFGFDGGERVAAGAQSGKQRSDGRSSRTIRRIGQYLREEWKPIALIALVVLVTIIISATMNGDSSSISGGNGNGGMPENSAYAAVDDAANGIAPSDPPTHAPGGAIVVDVGGIVTDQTLDGSDPPTYMPSTSTTNMIVVPTYSPTLDETADPSASPSVVSAIVPPTSMPGTGVPTMPADYEEMKGAAMYVSGGVGFDDASSPQSLAFDWLYNEGNPSTNLLEFFEQYAVAVLYFSLTRARTAYAGGNGDAVFDEWIDTREVCGWQGVRCAFNYTSEMVHVTDIMLSNKNLTGTIPNEIAFLPRVKRLDLSDNEVTGTVPDGVYGMKRLRHLYLNNNKLGGTIPPTIDNLNLAEQIYLGQNSFNGTLPPNIGTNRPNKWRFFSVYDNQLTGPIPEGMRLNEVFMLDLSRNEFYGTIPNDISHQNYTTLRLLYLDHNKLTGTIPGALMQIQKLKGLFLNDNRLEGAIPYDIVEEQKVNLLTIRVQNNQLTLPVASDICDLDVNEGEYELVELGVDCEICPSDCGLCAGRCY